MSFSYLYLPNYFAAEQEVAKLLARFVKVRVDPIPGWEAYCHGLDEDQQRGLESMMCHGINLLSGFPGTGKTTLIRRGIQAFDNAGMTGLVLAPTNQAAKRNRAVMHEIVETLNAPPTCTTTYRAMGYNPGRGGFLHHHKNPFDVDYIYVDEWGFVGSTHARDFLLSVNPKRTRLILSGDPYQLPSVEAGSVYRDLLNSRHFPSTELTVVHRTGANSGIAINAKRIFFGEPPVKSDPTTGVNFKDWKFIIKESEEETQKEIHTLITEKLGSYYGVQNLARDIQVISPGKKSEIGTVKLNQILRNALNPGKERYRGFRLGDKVIQRKTLKHHDLCNGDVGFVIEIGDRGLVVDFGEGAGLDGKGKVKLEGEDAEHLHLNYAQTVHTTQGSEMPVAVIPLHRCHWKLLSRNLLFTAQTRARQGAVIVGDPSAMQQCLRHSETLSRTTGLQHWLDRFIGTKTA